MMADPSETENATSTPKKFDVKDFLIQHRAIVITFGAAIIISLFLPGHMKVHVFSGILSGTLTGLVPFFVARFYKQYRTAQISLITCILSGGMAGLFLVLPLTLIFLVIISIKANRSDTHSPPPSGA